MGGSTVSAAQFRVSWEMPPSAVVAYDEIYGPNVWRTLTAAQWDELPWGPCERVTDDEASARAQFEKLSNWARTHEHPIRNVKLETAAPATWIEVT